MDKQEFLNDINQACGLNLNIDFIDMLLENQKKLAIINDIDLQETIKHLSKKYEIVLLTNWYTDTQIGRLKTAGIAKYFKEFYGGDLGNIKPHPDSFLRAIGSNKIEQCIMIGDSDYHDIVITSYSIHYTKLYDSGYIKCQWSECNFLSYRP